LGAIAVDRGGRVWTQVKNRSLLPRHVWTRADTHGRCLEIYGSEGWVFESPRARTAPAQAGVSSRGESPRSAVASDWTASTGASVRRLDRPVV
jgi:hypothetical protein